MVAEVRFGKADDVVGVELYDGLPGGGADRSVEVHEHAEGARNAEPLEGSVYLLCYLESRDRSGLDCELPRDAVEQVGRCGGLRIVGCEAEDSN